MWRRAPPRPQRRRGGRRLQLVDGEKVREADLGRPKQRVEHRTTAAYVVQQCCDKVLVDKTRALSIVGPCVKLPPLHVRHHSGRRLIEYRPPSSGALPATLDTASPTSYVLPRLIAHHGRLHSGRSGAQIRSFPGDGGCSIRHDIRQYDSHYSPVQ